MTEHLSELSSISKKTVWYGVGQALENLGPKAWEQRAKTVIETRIIPSVSPEWQERWERNAGIIAKATGWVATAVEVGVVAGVTYGGYKGLRSILEKRTVKASQKYHIPVTHIESSAKTIPIRILRKDEPSASFITNKNYKKTADVDLGDMTLREKLRLWALRLVGESANMPVGLRVQALKREHLLTHKIRRRIHPGYTPASVPNIDHIHAIAEDTSRRVVDVVGRVRDVRNAKRLQKHQADQSIKLKRMNKLNLAERTRILDMQARRVYEQWSASLGESPVAEVLRQAEVMVHNRGDEVVRNMVLRLRSLPHETSLQQLERSKTAAQLFTYILDRQPELQRQFGVGSAKDGAIAAKAADWVRKNLPGIEYLT